MAKRARSAAARAPLGPDPHTGAVPSPPPPAPEHPRAAERSFPATRKSQPHVLGVLLSTRGSEKPRRNFPAGAQRRGGAGSTPRSPQVRPFLPPSPQRGSAGRALPRAALRTHPSPAALPAGRRLPAAPGRAVRAGTVAARGPAGGEAAGAAQRAAPAAAALRSYRPAN